MKPEPEEADRALFRAAIRDVKPLARPPRVPLAARKPAPRARFTRADVREVLEESLRDLPDDPPLAAGDEMAFSRPGLAASTLRKLRRGQYRVQAELDLHGLSVRATRTVLREFLREALLRDHRCVRIIHGKGLRSGPAGPVLKQAVNGILRHNQHVVAFVSARRADGGTGAIYALLAVRSQPASAPAASG